jgi:hypothetical protein
MTCHLKSWYQVKLNNISLTFRIKISERIPKDRSKSVKILKIKLNLQHMSKIRNKIMIIASKVREGQWEILKKTIQLLYTIMEWYFLAFRLNDFIMIWISFINDQRILRYTFSEARCIRSLDCWTIQKTCS